MELVHFGEDLKARTNGFIGTTLLVSEYRWISDQEMFSLLKDESDVKTRAASSSERKRAEAMADLYELGRQMSDKMRQVYDYLPADEMEKLIRTVSFALTSVEPPVLLLDQD
jgi:hypothetical protein